ncbi:hypothetical protein K440DRAFT_317090 [Wilcoxina mikolae CBS 423.85]|nr:hypothetical protein K440DRAFT_317090 [Wilcoxina mikolae CBS 423.85]
MDMEKPRFVFAFGATPNSYFIGCGKEMAWNGLPAELESILINRASEVLAISLGEKGAFYCRYLSKVGRNEYTVSGNLPVNLSFLLSCWFANPYERPHVAFGPSGSYFFQSSALSTWENLPYRLDTLLNELREAPDVPLHPRSLSLGWRGGFVFLAGEDGEFPMWDNVDPELAHRLSGDGEKIVVETASLSLACQEDYLVVFSDGSIFYSVPDSMVPIVKQFVCTYHMALEEYEHEMAYDYVSIPPSPRVEMAAAMAAAAASKTGKNGERLLSLALPDGILGWDEAVITEYIKKAVGSSTKSGDTSPASSPGHDRTTYGRPNPYSPGNLASRRGMAGVVSKIETRWDRKPDHQEDLYEIRGGFEGKGGFDPLGIRMTRGKVIEL